VAASDLRTFFFDDARLGTKNSPEFDEKAPTKTRWREGQNLGIEVADVKAGL
jgi:hypothetical protein